MKHRGVVLLYSIGLFFLIFAFPLIPGISSAKLMFVVVGIIYLKRGDFKRQMYLATNAFGKTFLYSYLLMFILTLAMPILWQSYDISLIIPLSTSILLYYVTYLYLNEVKRYIDINKTIYYCFFLQSVFILLAILSQDFYDITTHFRDVSDHNQIAYGRLRGNAISGYQFFGIVVMYSFGIIFWILHQKTLQYKLVTLPLILIMAICSGRSIVLSIAIALICYIIQLLRQKKTKKIILALSGFVGIVILSYNLLINNYQNIRDPFMRTVVERYLVDPLQSLESDDEFETSSTDSLIDMYNSTEIKKHFMLGSGRYSNEDGSYFGHVDIGYYRILGYYGYIGLILSIFCFWALLFKSKSNLDNLTKWAFMLNLLGYNFKGGVFFWGNNIVPLLVSFLFFCNNRNQDQFRH